MLLKTAIGVYYQEDQLDIEVVGKGFKDITFLGNLTLTGTSQKDPLLIKAEVKDFFGKIGVSPENVVVALSPDQVAFRRLNLPLEVGEEGLQDAVKLQLMNIVPSDIEDFCTDWVANKKDDKNGFDIDIYIIPREKVKKIIDFLSSLNLRPAVLTLTSFGFEKIISMKKGLLTKPVFIADLDFNDFSIYAFDKGKFSYFKLAWVSPDAKKVENVLKEVERCAALVRLPEEAEIEIFANISDHNWEEKLEENDVSFLRPISECSPFENRSAKNLKPFSAAIQALEYRNLFNLIPKEWRIRTSRFSLIPTFILAAGVFILLLLNMSRGVFQESSYINFLQSNMERITKPYRNVVSLKHQMVNIKKELNTYNSIIKKPISDLLILRELTEKAGEKTYLNEYVRTDKLVISGYTDSVLDLQTRLDSIPYFKNIQLQGSITKTREGLEHFRFVITLEAAS